MVARIQTTTQGECDEGVGKQKKFSIQKYNLVQAEGFVSYNSTCTKWVGLNGMETERTPKFILLGCDPNFYPRTHSSYGSSPSKLSMLHYAQAACSSVRMRMKKSVVVKQNKLKDGFD